MDALDWLYGNARVAAELSSPTNWLFPLHGGREQTLHTRVVANSAQDSIAVILTPLYPGQPYDWPALL